MPALGMLGFQGLLFGVVLAAFFVIRHKWRNAVAKKEEIMRLVAMASEEAAMAEFQATTAMYAAAPPVVVAPVTSPFHCAVCYSQTTMRCSKCKSVRYCSGKCQIIHWRQGHKDECRPSIGTMEVQHNSDIDEEAVLHRGIGAHTSATSPSTISWDGFTSSGTGADTSSGEILNHVSVDRAEKPLFDGTAPDLLGNMSEYTNLVNCRDNFSPANKLVKMKSSHNDKEVESESKLAKAKIDMSADAQPANFAGKKPTRRGTSIEKVVTDAFKSKRLSTSDREDERKEGPLSNSGSNGRPSSTTGGLLDSSYRSEKVDGYHALPAKIGSTPSLPQNACNGLKTSMKKVVQQFKSSKQLKSNLSGPENGIAGKFKVIFPYELFVKLYSYNNVDLCPFGLTNCGNSCYANAVLQCLAFTQPLTSYLLQGLHSRACQKKDWCFICEFEILLLKAREGKSSLSPIRILSRIHKIGSHLGHGKEEDAHEFLRYAVDTMQSVCLKEAGAIGPLAEQTTLVGMTFGGHLRSKIKCMKCLGKTEQFERMMDLTVEIDGAIGTLEEALAQFTATETLDGDNRFHCNRCKSYEKARKKLTVLEAPNILTIVLKRFQSRNFEKLDKSVRFPEVLNLSPYMDRTSDKSPLYNLYAVIVHLDIMNAAYSGHYICYVKNSQGNWFKINDSSVEPVELKRVLSEGAYMLLYARRSPRPPPLVGSNALSHAGTSNRRNSEAVPSSLTKSKLRYTVPSMNSSAAQPKSSREWYRMSFDGSSNQSLDPDDWRSHSMYRVPAMDSLSESSSIFSSSDASSCSTVSTKDSSSNEDLSDYIFGQVGTNPYSQFRRSSDVVAPSLFPNFDVDMKGRTADSEGGGNSTILCSDRSRHRRKSTSD
ncbi:ubiquitin carboxyl-terminal hydrolase 17 isoform X2 [Rosa chinensis]|uniref:ubiquitin carboxyl-terminal hydrolase 17 isoform X2 n=1 Tax=Rosa chinensis TaxID=74649 RepID=UPI000D08CAE4|nr:ubiquitin carboxyl-terminal hydrolase 17 isoform X2 [Rosa chinensis]